MCLSLRVRFGTASQPPSWHVGCMTQQQLKMRPWLAATIVGFAIAYLGTAVFGWGRHPRVKRSRAAAETPEEADLATAVGAMNDEGAPAERNAK